MPEIVERAEPGSFRDPSGFIFERDGEIYRQVNAVYRDDYDQLIESGLYDELKAAGLIVAHEEVDLEGRDAYKLLRVERIPLISYPYEWCFSALRDAALLTLDIQKRAVARGMSLKDASAYNVQFRGARAVLIDTLSFERLRDDRPWVAYRQFCRHFLAPLALMAMRDVRLAGLLRDHIDGLPLDLASRLLPSRSRLSFGLFLHIHLHAGMEARHGGQATKPTRSARFGRNALLGLAASLEAAVRRLNWEPKGTEWIGYASDTNYSDMAATSKRTMVEAFLGQIGPTSVWDLGANTGEFSRIAASGGIPTVSMDIDPACVEANYREARAGNSSDLLPLVMDLTNPSPGLGWAGNERASLADRGPADAVMALALIHHLAIGANVPLDRVAAFLADLSHHLIIEFVPKEDSQVARLLVVRDDVFPDYNRPSFEGAFARYFHTLRVEPLAESGRILYLMKRKNPA